MKRRIIQIISHSEEYIEDGKATGQRLENIYGLANDGTLWWFDDQDGWIRRFPGDNGIREDEEDYPEFGNRK